MLWIKIRFFSLFLTVLCVGADPQLEKDVSFEQPIATKSTAAPIVLLLSTTTSPDDLKSLTDVIKKNAEDNHHIQKHIDNRLHVNDIEVFSDKLGPKMEKQEEEEEAAEPEEEAKPEEDNPEEEMEPPAGDEAGAEEEEETAVEEEETPAEAPTEEKDETVAEAEEETPNEETAAEAETAADNDMANDEPTKDEDNVTENPDDVTRIAVTTDDNDKNKISCFNCTSNEDLKCHETPTQQSPCPNVNGSEKEKQHGCYTLYETDTNTTIRGCVDELAEEGLKYCLTNQKLCKLCYKTGCNNQTAPNSASIQSLNSLALLTTIMTLMSLRNWS